MTALYISATHKSSGKTTITTGLCAALRKRNKKVQPFKKGPDYIDPIWLQMAARQPCYNLDFFVAGRQQTLQDFHHYSLEADISIIEGNKGLYDGLDLDGSNSNAALASALDIPVILVVDARGTMRGIAPLLIGYQAFDRKVRIGGVIANMTGGTRHEDKLRAAVEHYTDIPFLGAISKQDSISIEEKHLGLVPANEDSAACARIERIAMAIEKSIDLEQLTSLADNPAAKLQSPPTNRSRRYQGLRIGIARDRAFGFYYQSDLEMFQSLGAELVAFDTLSDTSLPEVDGLFIGGGFPERYAAELSANQTLRASIAHAIEAGLPTYAECGGLMYLSRQLRQHDKCFDMVGALPGQVTMHERPCGRGYVKLQENTDTGVWPISALPGSLIRAHEFHYSSYEPDQKNARFAYTVKRGNGITNLKDGLVHRNVLASYAHLRHTRQTPWIDHFLDFVARHSGKILKDTGLGFS